MSKRIAGLLIALSVSAHAWAQDEGDALRYSRLTTGGTARTQAIGGAAGSLGGDITASHVNPAGLGFFRTSEIVITPGFYFRSNQYDYLNTKTDQEKSGFSFHNLGVVFGMPTSSKSGWRNVAFSLNYNRLADFNNKTYIAGVNTNNTYTEKWLEDLTFNNVNDPNDAGVIFPLGASLAFNTYLVDVDTANDGTLLGYRSRVNPAGGIYQQDQVTEKGGMNEFSIGLGANYTDQLYLGLSLNFPTINYERNRTYAEDDDSGDANNEFSFFEHSENLQTDAVGFNAKLGAIYSPQPNVRLGVAFHTPTWFSMRDASNASILVNTENFVVDGQNERYQTTGDLTDGYPVEYEYSLQTPWHGLISASYIFGTNADVSQQHGFITADVEYVDYSATKFRFNKGSQADREFANNLNRSIDNLYKGTVNVRVGGEMKFTVLAVRAGFAYYGDPYQHGNVDASMKKISGGLGYRNRGFFADLTYVHTLMKDEYYPYKLQESPTPVLPATVDASGGNIVATVGFKF
ncbi:OmpP1/FadL family transporter [Chitinophaga cymbidii]|uniref:Transporter n=1 Tax=Chitinophaga cymbidii TaxID=1096750 RepID=A0A512RQ96_9BACT|nr:hypothetical protein [Chitinophaga cymbidii]GEP97866.1 transporter [Chitinophaga cymbidii]